MNSKELSEILERHKLWLSYYEEGTRADLRGANLRLANLIDADLSRADLSRADLRGADLSRANLRLANLIDADLSRADLRGADLRGADLSRADLSRANLIGADLSRADLSRANLIGADLIDADLSRANLSRAKGLLDAAEWMKEKFESTSEGVVVYKAFGDTFYYAPERWEISEGSCITEICNPCRTNDCGCGVNFGTLEWIQKNINSPTSVWKCLIEWIDLVSVVVPYNTDGKARCGRLKLIERIE
jgi:hypothetical protein